MSEQNLKTLARVTFVVIFAASWVGALVVKRHADFVLPEANANANQNQRPGPENNYFFSEPTPSGDWFFRGADFDIQQAHDDRNPVGIGGITSYMGKGNWLRHLMIESIVLINRQPTPITGFKLGWIIMSAEDHDAGKNREAALLAGETALIDPGFTNRSGRTKPFNLEVLKAARPLIKNGSLSGTFFIRIRLTEVRFSDGPIWRENQN